MEQHITIALEINPREGMTRSWIWIDHVYEQVWMTSMNIMKNKRCVDVEDGIDGVERLDLDDGRGGEAHYGASRRAMASCNKLWPATAGYGLL